MTEVHVIHWPQTGSRRSFWWVVTFTPGKGYLPLADSFGRGPVAKAHAHDFAKEVVDVHPSDYTLQHDV